MGDFKELTHFSKRIGESPRCCDPSSSIYTMYSNLLEIIHEPYSGSQWSLQCFRFDLMHANCKAHLDTCHHQRHDLGNRTFIPSDSKPCFYVFPYFRSQTPHIPRSKMANAKSGKVRQAFSENPLLFSYGEFLIPKSCQAYVTWNLHDIN